MLREVISTTLENSEVLPSLSVVVAVILSPALRLLRVISRLKLPFAPLVKLLK
ncbi:MAG: hypothetical protein ABIG09_06230 [bacterium]